MALIKCSECGHDVSSLAKACPNCGMPVIPAEAVSNNDLDHTFSTERKRPPRRRWLRGGFFALILGALGFYGGAIIEGSMLGASIGAAIGVVVGFSLAGRKSSKSLKPHSMQGLLGILLAIAGLVAAYIAYEPARFKAVVVYPTGERSSHPARFSSKRECITWTQNQVAINSDTVRNNPGVVYEGIHTYVCEPADCSRKLDCTIKDVVNRF